MYGSRHHLCMAYATTYAWLTPPLMYGLRHHQLGSRGVRDAHLGGEDLVDYAVVLGLLRRHEEVAVAVILDLLNRLPSVVRDVLAEQRPDEKDFLRLNLNVRGLALRAAQWLVDHGARVRKAAALALGASAQKERAHRCR